jgi:DNA-binding transcriptional LysR family regulator
VRRLPLKVRVAPLFACIFDPKVVRARTTTRFGTLPLVLRRFQGIASLPETAARELGGALGLTVSPLPVEVPPVDLSLVWHARHETDAGHQWLRELVYRVCMRFAPPEGHRAKESERPKGRARKAR